MPRLKCVAQFQGDSGLPEDRYINTFSFLTLENSVEIAQECATRLQAFYSSTQGSGSKVEDFFSAQVSRATDGAAIKVYNPLTPEAPPMLVDTWTLGAQTSANTLPLEVACVLSFKNDSSTSVPMRNRRGRIYLGPLQVGAQTATAEATVPSSTFITTVRQAAEQLAASSDTDASWCVWSGVKATGYVVESGWIDNAWDTQRRRGAAATARTTW